jgi:DNA-binding transcriptional MocR family regulator
MLELDGAGERVVYASSFSKTVCPGIRVGYLVGAPDRIGRIVKIATNTYISPNMVAESIVNQFCRSGGMDGAIATVKEALRERRDVLCSELSAQMPDARFVEPEGGYFLWIDLPEGTDGLALFDAAAERGLQFVKGTDFFLEGGNSSLRLAYSGVNPDQIREGVGRLAEAYNSL